MKKSLSFLASFLILVCCGTAAALTPEERANIEVFRKASPSVVNITTTTLIRDFFSVYPQQGAGSGTIIGKDGYVLTNFHVVEGANRIQVTLSDGSKYPARIIGLAPENDLAIIKIEADRTFKPLPLGDSGHLLVGQRVYAIGNPFGLNSTLTTGIISAVGRPLTTEAGVVIENVIQTDAPINPGNSGGPLIDTSGRVVGVNTAIFTPSGGSVGIGFAIPINSAKKIIPDLIKYGRVRKPWLGITGVPLWEELAVALDIGISRGILVSEVVRGSPADEAGIRGGTFPVQISRTVIYLGGDVITEIDGREVTSMEDIREVMRDKREGQVITVKLFRRGSFMTVRVRVKLKT